MKPQRIQLSRRKGFDLQKISRGLNGMDAVNCARPSYFGNPFSVLPHIKAGTRVAGALGYIAVPSVEDAIACFREFISHRPDYQMEIKRQLHNKNLACWCDPGEPCHCDVLLEIANSC